MTQRRIPLLALAAVMACGSPQAGPPVRVSIPTGTSVRAIADTLVAHRVLRHPRWFRWYVTLSGNEGQLQAGTYDLGTPTRVRTIVRALTRGGGALDRLVIPEGTMLVEIADIVERDLGVPTAQFFDAARAPDLRRRVGARGPTLEGYLYPSTYHVRVGASAREVVVQMLDTFEDHWDPRWDPRLDTLGLTRDEAVTLASIIEGEVRHAVDRGYVASVYHNRLTSGMRLEADPTVIYALGIRRRLFVQDYRFRSPYNTYLIDGLPPHPIGQPSAASIDAALHPRRSDFLFFVAGPDGKHIFSRTYREHLAVIRRLRTTVDAGP